MNNKRLKTIYVCAVVLLCALCVRITYFALVKNAEYSKAVAKQQFVTKKVTDIRGTIYDRNMIPLTEREMQNLSLGSDGNISSAEGDIGFSIPARYSSNGLAAHLIGYVDSDSRGMSAIEQKYDSVLGNQGYCNISYNADGAGRPYSGQLVTVHSQRNRDACSIRLTLDYHIQRIAENVMDKYIDRGAAVILDTHSFDVLAMVSRPLYGQTSLSNHIASLGGELLNRALCEYNAGSVFKIVTAAAALEANSCYGNTLFYCDGHSDIEGRIFSCHKTEGHKLQNFADAFANSCNCAFYETGIYTGGDRICVTALKLGLGESVLRWSVEEASGNITLKDEYSPLETVNISIGQGEILITPLQCAVMAATVANGGIRKRVNVVEAITDEYGNVKQNLKEGGSIRAFGADTARHIGDMMRKCVTQGTAQAAAASAVDISGKTGSAETGWLTSDGDYAVHGWFCGYFPSDNPRYAMAIFCEDGKSGAESCVEPFVKICEEINKIYPSRW